MQMLIALRCACTASGPRPVAGLRPALVLAALILGTATASPAELRLYSGGAPRDALQSLIPQFERQSGHCVRSTFGLVTVIQQKLTAGEKADVVLLPVPLLDAVGKNVVMRRDSQAVLARVGIGVVVRAGASAPDISTADAVRRMLLDARSIVHSDPSTPTASHLTRLFARLGVAEAVNRKLTIKAAIDGGVELVAKGEAEVGMFLVSEILPTKGIALAGPLPAELQSFVTYGAAIPTDSAAAEPAAAFVRFISDTAHRQRWTAAGFEPMGGKN
jgi:molybdate transport system substrate-binding protein